jgi:hypothetical protein
MLSKFEFTIAFYLDFYLTTKLYASICTLLMTVYEIQDQLITGGVHEECIKSSLSWSRMLKKTDSQVEAEMNMDAGSQSRLAA